MFFGIGSTWSADPVEFFANMTPSESLPSDPLASENLRISRILWRFTV